MQITVNRLIAPFANAPKCFTISIVTMPIAPPITLAQGERRCMKSGRISPAAATNTTPAAKC